VIGNLFYLVLLLFGFLYLKEFFTYYEFKGFFFKKKIIPKKEESIQKKEDNIQLKKTQKKAEIKNSENIPSDES
jgi:hypothetical protein